MISSGSADSGFELLPTECDFVVAWLVPLSSRPRDEGFEEASGWDGGLGSCEVAPVVAEPFLFVADVFLLFSSPSRSFFGKKHGKNFRSMTAMMFTMLVTRSGLQNLGPDSVGGATSYPAPHVIQVALFRVCVWCFYKQRHQRHM